MIQLETINFKLIPRIHYNTTMTFKLERKRLKTAF
jgi:hypothetical protein